MTLTNKPPHHMTKLTDPSEELARLQVIALDSRWGLEQDCIFHNGQPLNDNEWEELLLILGNDPDLAEAKELALGEALLSIQQKREGDLPLSSPSPSPSPAFLLASAEATPRQFQFGIADLQDSLDAIEGVDPGVIDPITPQEWEKAFTLLGWNPELQLAIDAALEQAAVQIQIARNEMKLSNK